MRPNLTCITLGVGDFEKSLRFYREGLGWPAVLPPGSGSIAFLPLNGVVLALYPKHLLAEDATVSSEGRGFPGFTLAHNTRSEEEVNSVLTEAEKAGATIVKPAERAFWGGYSGYFKDPDGYLWEVVYNPEWKLDSSGRPVLE